MKVLIASYAFLSIILGASSAFALGTSASPEPFSTTSDSSIPSQVNVQSKKLAYTQYCDCTVYEDGSKWCQCW